MLTPKQEKFVQSIVSGMSQREAYKNAYDAKNMADDTIDNKACNLFKTDKIRARYDELIQKLEDKAIMSAKARMEFLTRVIENVEEETAYDMFGNEFKKKASFKNKLAAVDILNKMDGQYITKIKAEVNSDINITIE